MQLKINIFSKVRAIIFRLSKIEYAFFYVIFLGIISRSQHLTQPLLNGHIFRQTQTATVARNFYLNGINFLYPQLDILGVGKSERLILEFPLYQAIVAFLARFFGFSDELGRIVSIFLGMLCSLLVYKITIAAGESRLTALVSIIFFTFFPINIFYQQAFMIESIVVLFHLFSIYLLLDFERIGKQIIFFFYLFVGVLAIILKVVYAPIIIPIWIYIFWRSRKKILFSKKILLGLIIALLSVVMWQMTADELNMQSGHIFFTSKSLDQWIWNAGLLQDRFSIQMWNYRFKLFIDGTTKPALLFSLIGFANIIWLKNRRNRNFYLIWLVSVIVYYLVFFRIQSHNYYLMPVLPLVSIFSGIGFSQSLLHTCRYFKNEIIKRIALSTMILIIFVYGIKAYINTIPYFSTDEKLLSNITQIKKNISEPGYVLWIFPQVDWNSVYSYYSGTKGVVLDQLTIEQLSTLSKQEYRYVVVFYEKNLKFGSTINVIEDNCKLLLKNTDMSLWLINSL